MSVGECDIISNSMHFSIYLGVGGQTAQRPGGKFDKIIFKDLTLNTVMNGGQQKRVAESVLIMFILSFEIITKLETTSLGTGLKD